MLSVGCADGSVQVGGEAFCALEPDEALPSSLKSDQGCQSNSRVLSALAVRVADDPFKKVKKKYQGSDCTLDGGS